MGRDETGAEVDDVEGAGGVLVDLVGLVGLVGLVELIKDVVEVFDFIFAKRFAREEDAEAVVVGLLNVADVSIVVVLFSNFF